MDGVIGITGGIGAGKSTVLEILSGMGLRTLDSDPLVHSFYAPGDPLVDRLVSRWGPEIRDEAGGIRRQAVASRVFGQPDELDWLNKQVHPRVRLAIQKEASRSRGYLFCAVPLLFELGWEREMTAVWTVWCRIDLQKKRLRERDWSDQQIQQRLDNQLPMDEKLHRAEFVLVNNGSRQVLKEQVSSLLRHFNLDVCRH